LSISLKKILSIKSLVVKGAVKSDLFTLSTVKEVAFLVTCLTLRFPEASEVLLDCAGFVLTGAS
jgi:hypothetical protein